jgi:hypothetical protein
MDFTADFGVRVFPGEILLDGLQGLCEGLPGRCDAHVHEM